MFRTGPSQHAQRRASPVRPNVASGPQLSLLTSTQASTPASSARSPLDAIEDQELTDAQRTFPRLVNVLYELDDLVHYHEARYDAKDAELTRCIHVGEELIEQLDQLKERCRVLAHERDELREVLSITTTTATAAAGEHATKSDASGEEYGLMQTPSRAGHHAEAQRLAVDAALEARVRQHEEESRRQEAWWQARLESCQREHERAAAEWRTRDAQQHNQHERVVAELEKLRQRVQDSESAVKAARRAEEAAQQALEAQQKENTALRRDMTPLAAKHALAEEKSALAHAELSQQLAVLQTQLRALQENPEDNVPVTSALLTLTSAGHRVQQQLQQLLAQMIEGVQEAEEEDMAVEEETVRRAARSSRNAEGRKILANASALASKTLALPDDRRSRNGSAWPPQGVHHTWLQQAMALMADTVDALLAIWRVNSEREGSLRRAWREACERAQHAAQSLTTDGTRQLADVQSQCSARQQELEVARAELARVKAEHTQYVDTLVRTHETDLDDLRATMQQERAQEKQRLEMASEAKMQSVLVEAQLEVERLRRANGRLQGQLTALATASGTAHAREVVAAPNVSSALVSTSPTLTDTLRQQAEEITKLESQRDELQRRLREEEAGRQALREELAAATQKRYASQTARYDGSGVRENNAGALISASSAQRSQRTNTDLVVVANATGADQDTIRNLEETNRNLRSRLVLVVREAQDELDGLQAQNVCLVQDLAKVRSENETMRRETLPELESAAKEWQRHRQTAQQELRALQAALEAKQDAQRTMQVELEAKEAALAAAQRVRGELETMGENLKEALGRAALDVQEQHAREATLQREKRELAAQVTQWVESHQALADKLDATARQHASQLTHAQDEVSRLSHALQEAEQVTASQQARLDDLELRLRDAVRARVAAEETERIATHTLEATQARADAAESALHDVEAELARQRRLTERARSDVQKLVASGKADNQAREDAHKTLQDTYDAQRAEADAAKEEQRRLEKHCTALSHDCDALRAELEGTKASCQARLEEHLQAASEAHRAAIRLRESQLQSLRARLEETEATLTRTAQRLGERDASLTRAHDALSQCQQEKEALVEQKEALQRALKAAQQGEAAAKEEAAAVRQEWHAAATTSVSKTAHADVAASCQRLQNRVAELEGQVKDAAQAAQRVISLEATLAIVRERLEQAEAQNEALHQETQVLRQRGLDAQAQHADATKTLRERLQDAEEQLADWRAARTGQDAKLAEALEMAQQARADAEAKVADLQSALAKQDAEAQVALDKVVHAFENKLQQMQVEVEASAATQRREQLAHQTQAADAARQREIMQDNHERLAHELDVSRATCERLERRLQATRAELELATASQTAERKELEALRRVNRVLEDRLSEVERDREPLRQRLRHLLDTSTSLNNTSASVLAIDADERSRLRLDERDSAHAQAPTRAPTTTASRRRGEDGGNNETSTDSVVYGGPTSFFTEESLVE